MTLTPGFTGSPLDRADHVRGDEAALAAMRAHPDARLIRMSGLDPIAADDGSLALAPLPAADAGDLAFLGLIGGQPRFVTLGDAAPDGTHWHLWGIITGLPAGEAATYAAARSLVDWHARHRFCARCGTATSLFRAGWARACPGCKAEHFPRTDPVVIMLAQHRDKVLVGRQHRWPPGLYSALAGFVEVGESIEDAVARELKEEAGVEAIAVRYLASQPWPFPSSLMIACIADVRSDAVTLDDTEIESAMWIDRDQARAVIAGAADAPFRMASPFAIAHTLIKAWAEGA